MLQSNDQLKYCQKCDIYLLLADIFAIAIIKL